MMETAASREPLWVRIKDPLLWLLLAVLGLLFVFRYSNSLRGTDFPDFYCASRMLLAGQGHELYDIGAQHRFQARYAGRVGTPYIHPPFEALVYLTVAWLPLHQAFRLWAVINLGLLVLASRRMTRNALVGWDWRLVLASSLIFAPVLLCLLQGQDSILLLLVVVLSFGALKGGQGFAAGCWLGLGLFKFQIVLPVALVLARQKGGSRFVRGFVVMAVALAAASAAISGPKVFVDYPRFLLHLSEQPFAGVIPSAMANFRGLMELCLNRAGTPAQVAAIALLSAAALVIALWGWRKVAFSPVNDGANLDIFDLAFANTVVFALLVSYHLNPHDLSLLLLPMWVLVYRVYATNLFRHSHWQWWTTALTVIAFLPPLHLLALQAHRYAAIAFLILALCITGAGLLRAVSSPRQSLSRA